MSLESFSSGACSQGVGNDESEEEEMVDAQELEVLKPSQLRARAIAAGVEQSELDRADDEDTKEGTKERLIEAICRAPRLLAVSGKLFNDAVHEHFALPALCCRIVDTPEFQRLRELKQLGGTYWVFPSASHNRFEHSLGTAHLAGVLCNQLRRQQSALRISRKDVLCLQIAGLCHDLGHGPMSHMFDGKFLEAMKELTRDDWVPPHEELSTQLLVHLIEANGLWKDFEAAGLDKRDLIFIQEMIDHKARGEPVGEGEQGDGEQPREGEVWRKYGGREEEKHFLYEIISNDVNGVDVDKFDYFMRDALFLNIPTTFDPKRLLQNTRVARSTKDGKLHIAFHVKEAWNLYELFHTRYTLHKRAYQHKTANCVEQMLCEVLMLANDHLKYRGKDGALFTPYTTLHDMAAYAQLTDSVFSRIRTDTNPALRPAQELYEKVLSRDLYSFIAESVVRKEAMKKSKVEMTDLVTEGVFSLLSDTPRMERALEDMHGERSEAERGEMLRVAQELRREHLQVHIVKINYGKGDRDPVQLIPVYDEEPGRGEVPKGLTLTSERISSMVPKSFEEKYIRLYCKRPKKENLLDQAVIRAAFFSWTTQESAANHSSLVEPPTPARSSSERKRERGDDTGGASKATPSKPESKKRRRTADGGRARTTLALQPDR